MPRVARDGLRFGDNGELVDSVMIKDGLWDVYNDYHMGITRPSFVARRSAK